MSYTAPIGDILFTMTRIASHRPAMTEAEITEILVQAARICEGEIAPLNHAADVEGAHYANGAVRLPKGLGAAFQKWLAGGWMGVSLPAEFGGAGLPTAINTASMEMLTSACMALATLPVLSQGAVEALQVHASDTLKKTYLPKLVSGDWTATMNLTEPQAGTDLGLIRTRAVPKPDGSYRLFGNKIFITFGAHDLGGNIIHLVLARLPDAPAGTKGISLFLVPEHLPKPGGSLGLRNDLRCTGIEHKLGIKASPTCSMTYGEGDGAVGFLIGAENRGLACMFTMMNKARLATGLQGVAIAERAAQQAAAYAQQRRQGRAAGIEGTAPIAAHPDVQRCQARMQALVAAARALAFEAAAAIDANDEVLAGLLTPMVKAFCTDVGVEVASLNIQLHGGMGYVEETGAAQHWRDARIAPIYEGTNGVQAIDLVMRKIPMDGAQRLSAYFEGATSSSAKAAADVLAWLAESGRKEEEKLYVASPALRVLALALCDVLLARGARVAGADVKWAALSRVFAADVAVEATALVQSIRTPDRPWADYSLLT